MLPMLQTEPMVFGSAGGGAASATTAAGHGGPLVPVADLLEDSQPIFSCEADVGFDPFHLPGIGSCELQLGDTWGGMQSKMSAAAPVKKIRKKSESKPQSQINKCHNEKRRREQENEVINQLEELLGACLSDVKQPDKNGIVQEASQQIRRVLERRRECVGTCCATCPPGCRQHCPATPVQAGEVSSTQHQHDSFAYYSEISALIEAVKHYTSSLGWVLLEINCQGDIECVTDNIKDIIAWERADLYKQSIYTYIHHGDHKNLAPILQNVQAVGWPPSDDDKFHAIRSRLLIKGESPADPAGYVEVLIHAAAVRAVGPADGASVMCVIRRCEDASPGLLALDPGPPAFAHKQPAQITFKLDRSLKIINCDLSGVGSSSGSPACRALEGLRLLDLVEPADRVLVVAHLRESPEAPADPVVSAPFKIRVGHDKNYINVRAESRLFRNPNSQDGDFVMSTHSILSEEEVAALASTNPPVGGPLMTSVANGGASGEGRFRSTSPAEQPTFPLSDWGELDFQQPSWEYASSGRSPAESYGAFPFDEIASEDSKEKPMPPMPPTEEPNRLRSLLSKKPDGDGGSMAGANNRILKDLLKQEDEECGASECMSAPLTPHTPHTPAGAAMSPRAPPPATPPTPASQTPTQTAPTHNSDMLLRILNEKSDDDNEDGRRAGGSGQPSALLTQLLANGPDGGSAAKSARAHHDADGALYDRFVAGKRKADDSRTTGGAPTQPKRATPEASQVTSSAAPLTQPSSISVNTPTSSGMSALCQKNQILVSLLQKQQSSPTTPLPSPNPNLRSFPNGRPRHAHPAHTAPPPAHSTTAPPPTRTLNHATLTGILASSRATSVNGGTTASGMIDTLASSNAQSHLQMVLQGSRAYPAVPPYPFHFPPRLEAPKGEAPNDQTLSDLLDDVINELDPRQPESLHLFAIHRPEYAGLQGLKDAEMIQAIQQSLMQVETTVKSPSPGMSPGYSAQSPQSAIYGVSRVSGNSTTSGESPPLGAGGGVRSSLQAQQQRARLLQEQRRQAMLVPQGVEQAPGDLNNTIDALVNSSTPPNVALTRTDYHHNLYHPSSQVGSTYGTNKITSQQNPMLSAQLTSAYAQAQAQAQAQQNAATMQQAPAALHTPHTPRTPHTPLAPYHQRAARPHHMVGYYAEVGAAGAYCVDYARRAANPPHHDLAPPCGGGSNGGGATGTASEYVRQEIRAVVGARARPDLPLSHQHQHHQPDLEMPIPFEMPSQDYYGGGLGGSGGGR